jgi:hypothetical protein
MARKLLVVGAVAAALFVILAGPASAQFEPATLDVDFNCAATPTGNWFIGFQLDSPDVGGTTLFDPTLTAVATPDTEMSPAQFLGDIPAGGDDTASILVAGSYAGNIDWTVTYFEAGQEVVQEGNVELDGTCEGAPTTTTTIVTTTTTAPPAVVVAAIPAFTG